MKKSKKALWLFAPLFACAVLAGGCAFDTVSVTSIELTSSNGAVDTYTVTYSNGTSSTFTVKNGKDVTVQELYDRYKEEYGDDLTYEAFLEKYLTLTDASTAVICEGLASSFQIQAASGYSSQTGSGVLYSVNDEKNEAYVMTNYHVVYISGISFDRIKINCSLYGSDQTLLNCQYIGGAASTDIALLKVSLSELYDVNPEVKPVKIAESYCVGEKVYAIGNAEGNGISVTAGIVSVDSENITMSVDGTKRTHRAMRIDAPIYHGNSGGGLFNNKGELVGITNGGDEDDQNINYAIPLPLVTGSADNILHYYADGDATTLGVYKIELGFTANVQNSRYVYD
ncbi:MAG: S1C family serine protease, partial [Clostridiales bacterium]|nr:S1C family serine protease [Clostridiales bacterium]